MKPIHFLAKNVALLLVLLFMSSCDSSPKTVEEFLKGTINVQVNPYEKVPLGALLRFRTEEPCTVEIEVKGKVPLSKAFKTLDTKHAIPLLGLYADTTNTVLVKMTSEKGKTYTQELKIKTAALPDFFPSVEIAKIDRTKMEPGLHLIEMLIANNGKFEAFTIMFDDQGDIRWFMDMSSLGQIAYSPLRLQNGNWMYLSWINIWELTGLGELVRKEQMWGFAGDHHIIERSNGKFLMGGTKKDATVVRGDGQEVATQYDFIVEWDSKAKRSTKAWDLREVLDIDRSVYPEDFSLDFKADWFHINGLSLSPSDNSLVISGRNQGVLKVDQNNNLKWILAPHKDWGKAGRTGEGLTTTDYLLTAIDNSGTPFPEVVQKGLRGTDQFEWSTGQHAVSVLENGNILLFDNGLSRDFERAPTYSRAVEYKVDEENKTIQQVWEYGKSRGLDMWSPITSDVDVLTTTGNRLITAGNIRASKLPPHAKMIEITYPDNEEVFEAHIFFKDAKGTGQQSWAQFDLTYRGERYSLYPD